MTDEHNDEQQCRTDQPGEPGGHDSVADVMR
jgi:hypothetical protein